MLYCIALNVHVVVQHQVQSIYRFLIYATLAARSIAALLYRKRVRHLCAEKGANI